MSADYHLLLLPPSPRERKWHEICGRSAPTLAERWATLELLAAFDSIEGLVYNDGPPNEDLIFYWSA